MKPFPPNGEIRMYSVPPAPCMTPQGPGMVVHYEISSRWVRLGVVLDNNPFNYSPAYYHLEEVTGYTGGAA